MRNVDRSNVYTELSTQRYRGRDEDEEEDDDDDDGDGTYVNL